MLRKEEKDTYVCISLSPCFISNRYKKRENNYNTERQLQIRKKNELEMFE